MRLVIDTNIVFSALLNPASSIGDILLNIQHGFTFYAPELLISELDRYSSKIASYSKLNTKELAVIKSLVMGSVNFVNEELIAEDSWMKAFSLTQNVDEDDTPFVALSIELGVKLWTGDKVLHKGLLSQNSELIITTSELNQYLREGM